MAKPNVSIPKGTRDFSPLETARRAYIFSTIRSVYALHGFAQIETPALENLSTLMGKYGDEGDKLLFKVLNSGDFLSDVSTEDFAARHLPSLTRKLSDKGLRYDLTVPFARYVVMHHDTLQFPFKRYQIQPVWRADRPQKGRYREFYQCDADIVGSDSLLNEVELLQIIDEVFSRLNIRVLIKVNNRKILSGIADVIGESAHLTDITVAIDKLDKIGLDNVNAELLAKGVSPDAVSRLQPILRLSGSTADKLDALSAIFADSPVGQTGVAELRTIFDLASALSLSSAVELDLTLARGLNYYTGAIFEVKALDFAIGSITGGGRYDNLTGIFGLPGLSGVGISFGADRIYDVLTGLNLFPEDTTAATRVLFANFGEAEMRYILPIAAALRARGVSAEVFPDAAKVKKQFSYADARAIPYVALAGSDEVAAHTITLKDLRSSTQRTLPVDEFLTLSFD